MRIRLKVNDVEVECETSEDRFSSLVSEPLPLATKDLAVGPPADAARTAYDKRMGILSRHHLTVNQPIDTTWIVDRVKERIAGKTVVELGAGTGYLACALAEHAKHVFAIEVDVRWSWEFAERLYQTKPRNLTWIFDRAENLVDIIRADVAIVVTGSDEIWLRELARKFAPDVCMPWQDWNGGKAVISGFDGIA